MHRRPHLLRIATAAVLVALLASTASAQYSLYGWKISEFQPNVPQGGRASTIGVNPLNNDHILVASESGGLFRSTNRGVTWKHVDGLPEFGTSAVAFVPQDTSIVIATVGEDTRVANGGGIWRSTNGGVNWTQIPGPPTPPGVTTRLSALPSETEKNQDRDPSGRQMSPTAGRPYIVVRIPGGSAANTTAPGTVLGVVGRDFPRGLPLEIAVDDSTVERVVVGERGDFTASVRAPREFGLHSVTVRDAATRRGIDGAMFIVKPQDARRDEIKGVRTR